MSQSRPQPDPSSIPAFDDALRAILKVPKSDVLKAERQEKQKRQRQQSRRKGK